MIFEETCECDLKPGCDLLCCCDADCTELDRLSFNCQNSTNSNLKFSKKYCIPKKQYFSSNTPYILKEIEDLVCIEKESKFLTS